MSLSAGDPHELDKGSEIAREKSRIDFFNPFRGKRVIRRLEQIADPERQIENMKTKNIDLIRGEQLYNFNWIETQTRVFRHYEESQISCGNDSITRRCRFISRQSSRKLVESGYKNCHLGFILLGIQAMHRPGLGVKIYIGLIDTRHNNLRHAIVSHQEISLDKSDSEALIYIVPNYMVCVKGFSEDIQLIIKTHGYDMTEDKPNLYITKAFIGRISNHGQLKYTLDSDQVLNTLASHNIKCLDGFKQDSSRLDGAEWLIEALGSGMRVPKGVDSYEDKDGNLSIAFKDYHTRSTAATLKELDEDDPDPTQER